MFESHDHRLGRWISAGHEAFFAFVKNDLQQIHDHPSLLLVVPLQVYLLTLLSPFISLALLYIPTRKVLSDII